MLLVKRFFKVDITTETENFNRIQQLNSHHPEWKDLTVENPNLNNLSITQIPFFDAMDVVVTRILHNDQVSIASADSRLCMGDSIRLVVTLKNWNS